MVAIVATVNEKSIKVSVSMPGQLVEAGRAYAAKQPGISFSALISEALRLRLEALGVLGSTDTDAEDLAVCRELRSLGRDPQQVLAHELRRAAVTSLPA